jgi:putative CocE/NonD family hydrolase
VAKGSDTWRTDLTASTLTDGANRWNFGISTARQPLTFDGQADKHLGYTGAPLAADTEVTGHPIVDVVLSSSEAEGDVFAYLEDVAPDGTSLLVTEGQLRANYAARKPGGPHPLAKPALPWHGYARADYRAQPFAAGKVLKLSFDLMPTAWVFRKGHRILVSLAAADWPSFAQHPGLSPANDPAAKDTKVPVWTVRRGPGLSGITLPVVPARK